MQGIETQKSGKDATSEVTKTKCCGRNMPSISSWLPSCMKKSKPTSKTQVDNDSKASEENLNDVKDSAKKGVDSQIHPSNSPVRDDKEIG